MKVLDNLDKVNNRQKKYRTLTSICALRLAVDGSNDDEMQIENFKLQFSSESNMTLPEYNIFSFLGIISHVLFLKNSML